MKYEDIFKSITTPLGAPAYPMPPYRFNNREYLSITYRTKAEAIKNAVPEPLEVTGDHIRFELIKMPDVTGLGSYLECGQLIPVSFNGEQGEFYHAMYVDNFPAISVGREGAAFPKKLGYPRLFVDSDTLVGTLDYGSLRVATATMGYKHIPMPFDQAKDQIRKPGFLVKIIPNYDASLRICEIVRTAISDVEILEAWRGPARLQLFEHVMAPMADFPVLEILEASHIITNLSLGGFEVIHDYLNFDANKCLFTNTIL